MERGRGGGGGQGRADVHGDGEGVAGRAGHGLWAHKWEWRLSVVRMETGLVCWEEAAASLRGKGAR